MTSSFAAQTATQDFFFDLIREVCKFSFELTRDIVEIIIEINEDVGKNKKLRSLVDPLVDPLVDLYLKSTMETLNLFKAVDNFVERAKYRQHIIRFAVKQFEAESEDTDLGGSKKKKKYAKMLEELNTFEATEDPLGEEFVAQCKSVVDQQVKLLKDLCEQKENLYKKLKNGRKLKYFTYGLVGVVGSVFVALAMRGPLGPQVGQLARTQLAIWYQPFRITRASVSEMLNKYEKTVKTYKVLLTSMENSTKINKGATVTINNQVENLRGKISFTLESVGLAVEREEAEEFTRLAMQDIMKNVEGFTRKIEEVGERAAMYRTLIVSMRDQVLEHINNSKGE